MGVAYSQHRSIARTKVARADLAQQILELSDIQDTGSPALDECDPYWLELQYAQDAKFFMEHGHWPNWEQEEQDAYVREAEEMYFLKLKYPMLS
jgi:hypothetical protein